MLIFSRQPGWQPFDPLPAHCQPGFSGPPAVGVRALQLDPLDAVGAAAFGAIGMVILQVLSIHILDGDQFFFTTDGEHGLAIGAA
jgi:hypothetical protein